MIVIFQKQKSTNLIAYGMNDLSNVNVIKNYKIDLKNNCIE